MFDNRILVLSGQLSNGVCMYACVVFFKYLKLTCS